MGCEDLRIGAARLTFWRVAEPYILGELVWLAGRRQFYLCYQPPANQPRIGAARNSYKLGGLPRRSTVAEPKTLIAYARGDTKVRQRKYGLHG